MIDPTQSGMIAIGAGIAVGLCGIGAAIGEASIGAQAIRGMAKNEGFFGRGLLMTVIPESIAIFGLVIALIMLFVF